MSLEANLELNNQLLTQQNELQAKNIALLERLVSTLASGVAMRPDTIAKVQEYREAVPEPQPEPAEETKAALTLDDLEFSDVIALAGFYPEQVELSETMLQRAIDYRDAEGEKRVVVIDALDSALLGVKRAKALHKDVLLQLARAILRHWDELPTIAHRRAFAGTWLDAGPDERGEVNPGKVTVQDKKASRKGPFFVRHEDGKIGELSTEAELKAHLEAGYTEINKVEYLQRKEEAEKAEPDTGETDFAALRKQAEERILRLAKGGYLAEAKAILAEFGAQKMGQVPDDKLADVLALAENALEG